MKNKIGKRLYNSLVFVDISFLVVITWGLLMRPDFRPYLSQHASLMMVTDGFILLALGLSYFQNYFYPDKIIEPHQNKRTFIVLKDHSINYTLNPQSLGGKMIYLSLLILISVVIFKEIR